MSAGGGVGEGRMLHSAVFMVFSCCPCILRHRAPSLPSIRDVIFTALTTADRPAYACRTPPDNDIARRVGLLQGFSCLAVSCGLWWRGFLPCAATTSPGGPGSYRGFPVWRCFAGCGNGLLPGVARVSPAEPGIRPSFIPLACCVACRSPAPRAIGFPGMLPFRVSSAAGDHPENHSPAKVFVRFRPRARAARLCGPSTSPR